MKENSPVFWSITVNISAPSSVAHGKGFKYSSREMYPPFKAVFNVFSESPSTVEYCAKSPSFSILARLPTLPGSGSVGAYCMGGARPCVLFVNTLLARGARPMCMGLG